MGGGGATWAGCWEASDELEDEVGIGNEVGGLLAEVWGPAPGTPADMLTPNDGLPIAPPAGAAG
jgi:hypothetical protein